MLSERCLKTLKFIEKYKFKGQLGELKERKKSQTEEENQDSRKQANKCYIKSGMVQK